MEKKSVVLSLLSAFAATVVLLAGCGSQGSAPSSQGGGNNGVPTVEVGFVGVDTGGGASIGMDIKMGAQLAVEDINKEGKVKLNVHWEDSQAKNDLAVNAINRLIQTAKTPIVIGLWTGPNLSMAPIAERNKVLLINPGAQGDALAGANPYLFNLLPTLSLEEAKLAEYLVKERQAKKAAIFYQNDATGKPAMEDFQKGFEAAGGQVVDTEAVTINQTDFRNSISKALSQNPDVIFLGTTGGLVPLVQQIKQAGFNGILAGNSWVTDPDLKSRQLSKGIVHSQVAFNPPEDVKKRFKEKFNRDMGFFSHQGYEAMLFVKNLVLALKESGKEITGENARQLILKKKEFQGLSSKLVFDPKTNTADVKEEIHELQGDGTEKVISTIPIKQ